MTTSAVQAPNSYQNFQTRSGNQYTSDANGLILNVVGTDFLDLLADGCYPTQDPPNCSTQFGKGGAVFYEEGNLIRNVSAGISPGTINNDNVLAVYTLAANSFDISGRGLNFVAEGSVANNTNSKRLKLWFGATTAVVGSAISGGTLIADTGAYTTTGAAGWILEANVFKYGITGSNTQVALHAAAQIGSTVGSLLVPTLLTGTESGPIIVAVTGNAVTATTDIVMNFFEINAMN